LVRLTSSARSNEAGSRRRRSRCSRRIPADRTGEVDEEDLVETTPPQELRRQALHVVAGGDQEHLTVPLLQPAEEAAQHPLPDSPVPRGDGRREPLLDLIDPDDDRGDRLDREERSAEGERLGDKRLPAARNAQQEHPRGASSP
jgi:hypothetical protein